MTLTWEFPLPRPHTGVPLGNGLQGLLVWGATDTQSNLLAVTIGRAGFWDRRGGNAFATRTTFAAVKALLQAGDQEGLRRAFGIADHGQRQRPHQLGCGRLELELPAGWQVRRAELATSDAVVTVQVTDPMGGIHRITIRQAVGKEVAWIECPPEVPVEVRGRPSWEWIGDEVGPGGVEAPRCDVSADAGGWCQSLPTDEALACRWQRHGHQVRLATALGPAAWERAGILLATEPIADAAVTAQPDLPRVTLPDARLQHAWDLGVHRWLSATSPGGVACTLQGPWLEDYQIPPWSCDYHFNINVQMIYQPGLVLGRPDHFRPLWDLIRSWLPGLRAAGEAFFGVPGALLLPHAVDDRCQVVGAFWTGMIDHACTGWMALLAVADWQHGGDREVLETVAWPLLIGAHTGYRAMAEEREGVLSLPVSVSPEFKGSRTDAWGRDASFQLACWHAVLRALPQAAAALGHPLDPAWAATAAKLPPYSTIRAPRTREYPEQVVERIALWQGMDLIESHRHHSHLAGLWPFCTLDPADPAHAAVLRESLYHWVRTGPGAWSGWCVPWAATLCARMGWADAAVAWLHWQQEVFTNVGHGTLHDGDFPGCTTLAGDTHQAPHEIFQLDAGCGVLTAIAELLVQERAGVLHVLPALPRGWRELSFSRLRAAGGFELGAEVIGGAIVAVTVHAPRGGRLRLAHGLGERWMLAGKPAAGPLLDVVCVPGQVVTVTRS